MKRLSTKLDKALLLINEMGVSVKSLSLKNDQIAIHKNVTFSGIYFDKIKELKNEFKFLLKCRIQYHDAKGREPGENIFENTPNGIRNIEDAPKDIKCSKCVHYRKDQVGNGSGLGFCRAYLKTEWANRKHTCIEHVATNKG